MLIISESFLDRTVNLLSYYKAESLKKDAKDTNTPKEMPLEIVISNKRTVQILT